MTRHASSGREFVGKLKTEAWFNFEVQIKMKEKIEELLYVYISTLDLDRENFDPVLCCDHGCEKRNELNHLHKSERLFTFNVAFHENASAPRDVQGERSAARGATSPSPAASAAGRSEAWPRSALLDDGEALKNF